jgi:alkanesulfonate monooxygenase SsuD/methylene tetrahydromethanopterin reductase-like flavin-dependent oxidoreductase (luciferase family)
MQNKDTTPAVAQASSQRTAQERVGLAVSGTNAAEAVSTIVAAEAAGVRQIWMIQTPSAPDTLTIFAAASVLTTSVRLGTAIVPTYLRHPLIMVQQALAFGDLAPGRLRLGIGPSHRPTIEGVYGIPMTAPLEHLREYVAVLRAALWEGNVDHHGRFFTIKATLPRTPRTPILISALRQGAFQLAGEIADGAISWMCPVQYLLEKALPALQLGAANSERPVPPLVAHIPVALGQDRHEVLAASRKQINRYARLPFYANMFADAGFPVEPDESMSDNLIDSLVVSGDEATITSRLTDLLASGLDELIVMPLPVVDPAVELERLIGLIGRL